MVADDKSKFIRGESERRGKQKGKEDTHGNTFDPAAPARQSLTFRSETDP
jgi:hypothetical protein